MAFVLLLLVSINIINGNEIENLIGNYRENIQEKEHRHTPV